MSKHESMGHPYQYNLVKSSDPLKTVYDIFNKDIKIFRKEWTYKEFETYEKENPTHTIICKG